MFSGKEKIINLNKESKLNHDAYLRDNSMLVKEYQDKKDAYNNHIGIINTEKISMRDELRRLYDFLSFLGGELKKIRMVVDFVEEAPAPNISDDVEPSVEEVIPTEFDVPIIGGIINDSRAVEHEKKKYQKSLEYKRNLNKKKQAITRMDDCVQIAKVYRDTLVLLRDAIREKIIPEFEYIKAFLLADAIREKYIAGLGFDEIKPCKIIEYKGTRYNSHYQFVKNSFDFYDMCSAFFSKPVLTELMKTEELTDKQRDEFYQSVYEIQDKLALLESDMEVEK